MFKFVNLIFIIIFISSCNTTKETITSWTDNFADYGFSEIFSDRQIEEGFDLDIIEAEIKKVLKGNVSLANYNQITFREDYMDGGSGNCNYTVIFYLNNSYKIFDISFFWAEDNRTLLSNIKENKINNLNLLKLKKSVEIIKARYASWQLKIRCSLLIGEIESLFTIKENNEYIYIAQIEDCTFKYTSNLNISKEVMDIINMIRSLKTTK